MKTTHLSLGALRFDHEHEREGRPRRVVDESGEPPAIRTVATRSTCRKQHDRRSRS
jgi:hypothetical protein